ncbi:uncharacterized protein EI90DRAFT_3030075, partial [Cantharellus anzutake]|uniref:uncharacterized protein n=1 Tax=Cantharellus anzutake TaxID=1750568 RepID=UPI0019069C19
MVDVDEWTDGKDDHKLIANPYPPPVLPTSNWPRPQGPIPTYIRPKMQIPRPVTEVELDDFLAGIAPAPETLPKPEISATKEEPNDELTSADIEFESQEDRFFEGLNANVSRLLREKSISQLPLSDVQGPDSNGNPSNSTTQTNVEHNANQSGSKMNHNIDRKPLKSELEDLNVKYGKTYTAGRKLESATA